MQAINYTPNTYQVNGHNFYILQEKAFENAEKNRDKFIVARDVPKWRPLSLNQEKEKCKFKNDEEFFEYSKGYEDQIEISFSKSYSSFYDSKAYERWVKRIPMQQRCFYELVKADKPCYEYYDIDDWDDKTISPKELFQKFVKILSEFSVQIGLKPVNTEDMLCLDSSKFDENGNLTKGSLHIGSQRISFDNSKIHKEFFTKLVKFIKEKYPDFPKLDGSVYSNNRCFRMEGNTKLGQNRYLCRPKWGISMIPNKFYISANVSLKNRWDLSTEEKMKRLEEKNRNNEKYKNVKVDNAMLEKIFKSIEEGSNPRTDEETGLLTYEMFRNLVFSVIHLGANLEELFPRIWRMYRHHDAYNENDALSQFSKYSPDESRKSMIFMFLPKIDVEEEIIDATCNSINDEMININYVSLFDKYQKICVRANMGAGKTEKLSSLFQKRKRILLLTCKRSLAFASSITNKDFELYSDIEESCIDSDDHKRVIVQIDSLHRVRGEFDLVVIDEYIDIISQLLSSKELCSQNTDALCQYIRGTQNVLIMDANLRFKNVMKFIDDEKDVFITDSKKYHHGKEITRESEEQILSRILDDTNKFYVCSDSKRKIKQISKLYRDKYPEAKMLVITADVLDSTKRENFKNYDHVFVSPSITAGVSYCHKIDTVYGIYEKSGMDCFSSTQQLLRFRNWKKGYVYLKPIMRKRERPVFHIDIDEYLTNKTQVEINHPLMTINRIQKSLDLTTDSYFIYRDYISRKNESFNNFDYYYKKIFKEHGIKFSKNNNNPVKSDISELMKQAEVKISLDEIKKIVDYIPNGEDSAKYNQKRFGEISSEAKTFMFLENVYGRVIQTDDWITTYINKTKPFLNLKYGLDEDFSEMKGFCGKDVETKRKSQQRKLCQLFVKVAGFENIYDDKRIELNYDELLKFTNERKNEIATIFDTEMKDYDKKQIVRFINSKLKTIYGISLERINRKRGSFYKISGMDIWEFEKDHDYKPTIFKKENRLLQ